ncbi:MAG: hypothetical protein F4089_02515, partial [Gammaproteobacteria bacterium]|nr:hypothetical protein [Gammaproteobacteria bacterium]
MDLDRPRFVRVVDDPDETLPLLRIAVPHEQRDRVFAARRFEFLAECRIAEQKHHDKKWSHRTSLFIECGSHCHRSVWGRQNTKALDMRQSRWFGGTSLRLPPLPLGVAEAVTRLGVEWWINPDPLHPRFAYPPHIREAHSTDVAAIRRTTYRHPKTPRSTSGGESSWPARAAWERRVAVSMRGGSFGGGYSSGRGSFSSYRKGPTRERSSFKHLGHLKRLFPYLKQYRWVLGSSLLGLLATRGLMMCIPLLMMVTIDSLADPEIEPNYVYPALGILGIVILQSGIYVATRWALRRISIAITYDLRKRLFDHVQFQGPTFFNRFGTGDLMSRAVNDVRMVRMAASFGWVMIMQTLMMLFMG